MTAAVLAARDVSDLPIVASMTFSDDGRTTAGHSPTEVVNALNGPGRARDRRELQRRTTARAGRAGGDARNHCEPEMPLAGQPNAGWPMQVGDRVIYPSSHDYFANYAREAVDLGVRLIGGCCGTTPEHIAAMRKRSTRPSQPSSQRGVPSSRSSRARSSCCRRKRRRKLAGKIGRDFVVAVELDPPRGLNPAKMVAGAHMLKAGGVDARQHRRLADGARADERAGAVLPGADGGRRRDDPALHDPRP